jgi:hypothetical protein
MEGAGGAERGDLRVLRGGRTSPGHDVMYNTSLPETRVNEIPAHAPANTKETNTYPSTARHRHPDGMDEMSMTEGTKFS